MLNPFVEVNWNPDAPARRKFALSLVIGFPCLALFFAIITRLAAWKLCLWVGGLGCAIGLVLWVLPQIAKPFYVVWYAVGCCIGLVVGNLLFMALYYFVVTPMGLLRRALNPRAFSKNFDKSRATYWEDAQKVLDPKRYYRQF